MDFNFLRLVGRSTDGATLLSRKFAAGAIMLCASQAVANAADCPNDREDVPLGTANVCLPAGESYELRRDGAGLVYSVNVLNFDERKVVGQMLPGIQNVAIVARPSGSVDPTLLSPSPVSGVLQRQYGPLTFLYPERVTFFGAPFTLNCVTAFAPDLAARGAQHCRLTGQFDLTHRVEVDFTTVWWKDQPGWPPLDADFRTTWTTPLAALERKIGDFFSMPQ